MQRAKGKGNREWLALCSWRFALFLMPLDVKKSWNACGEAFDRFTSAEDSFSDNIERPAIKQLIGDITGARLLDLGCGSGTYSLWFAELGAQVVGLDISQTMISLAQAKASERGLKPDFRVADIREALPFPEAEFDMVFTGTSLHYVGDIDAMMKQVARVMKPGALLVASVLHPMSTALFPSSESEEVEGPNPWEGWYFGSPIRTIETPWLGYAGVSSEGRRIFCHHHTVSDYFNALTSAGLTVTALLEPAPSLELAAKNNARYYQAMRVPVFLILMAEPIT
ncbi:MAG: methyltransferase domain-containing protein [Acidobacteriota bacterium]